MPGNLEVKDTGLVQLETILTSYRSRSAEDIETAVTLQNRAGKVMTNANVGLDPTESQDHMFYTETEREDEVLEEALSWAAENNSFPNSAMAEQLLAALRE